MPSQRFTHDRMSESGNILIYVLGSIILLGLLIVVVRGNFQEGAGIENEKATAITPRVQSFAAQVERAVRKIMEDGYSETEIRFANDVDSSYGLLTDIPARQVFSPDGGAAEYSVPPVSAQASAGTWMFTGVNAVNGIGTTCTTASCADLIILLSGVTLDFCKALNDSKGVTNPSGMPPKETGAVATGTAFNGTFVYTQTLDVTGGYLDGQSEGCFEGNGGSAANGLAGTYYYYRVILAR